GRHGEVDPQQRPVTDEMRIEDDLDRLSMPGRTSADVLVVSGIAVASCIAGNRLEDSPNVLKDDLHPPEAPAREDGRLGPRGLRQRLIYGGCWRYSLRLGRRGG